MKRFVAKSMHTTLTIEPCAVTPWAPLPQPSMTVYVPVVLPSDLSVKANVEHALNPVERRRFRALWREAHDRNHNGVRTSVRLALQEMRHEVVERIERAEQIARGHG